MPAERFHFQDLPDAVCSAQLPIRACTVHLFLLQLLAGVVVRIASRRGLRDRLYDPVPRKMRLPLKLFAIFALQQFAEVTFSAAATYKGLKTHLVDASEFFGWHRHRRTGPQIWQIQQPARNQPGLSHARLLLTR